MSWLERTWTRVLGAGAAGVAIFLVGLVAGGAIVFVLHDNHWLANAGGPAA